MEIKKIQIMKVICLYLQSSPLSYQNLTSLGSLKAFRKRLLLDHHIPLLSVGRDDYLFFLIFKKYYNSTL